jgi:hypothetical protein
VPSSPSLGPAGVLHDAIELSLEMLDIVVDGVEARVAGFDEEFVERHVQRSRLRPVIGTHSTPMTNSVVSSTHR